MRLNVYRQPNDWLSLNITEEEWEEIKPYIDENNIFYTLVLENHEEIDLCFHDHFNLDNSGRITPSLIHSNRMNHILEVK